MAGNATGTQPSLLLSDMFAFDTEALRRDILLHEQEGPSPLSYHEYAVFTDSNEPGWPARVSSQSMASDERSGSRFFNLALREGHGLDSEGNFTLLSSANPALRGRLRQVICRRRVNFRSGEDGALDGLYVSGADFAAVNLHPATLQYVRRVTTESMFWDQRHETLSLILCFSADPRPIYDFMSLNYSIPERTTTVLIRESYDPSLHDADELDQYRQRMQACKSHWAHPLATPVVMLQVQFARTERAVAESTNDVTVLEHDVRNMAGFGAFESGPGGRRRSSFSTVGTGSATAVPKRPTELMKHAHDALKQSIKLLDTIRWMERSVSLLIEAGDALDQVRYDNDCAASTAPLASPPLPSPLSARGRVGSGLARARILEDALSANWHEIKQYLESLTQLCKSLGTDRQMLELRCKSQIDIIYAKMAQEDNILTARMAVASTRDSSSLKALAVITALFMPSEYIGTVFGMSMFDSSDSNSQAGSGSDSSVPSRFWLYWSISIPLTIGVITIWRAWWIMQDRYFRKHLSKELSEERYWTEDRRPRKLEHSFLYDFFHVSARRDEKGGDSAGPAPTQFSLMPPKSDKDEAFQGASQVELKSGPGSTPTFRTRQISFARGDPRKEAGVIEAVV